MDILIMGTTPKLKIPYVEKTETLADYPTRDQEQAERLEKLLSVRNRTTNVFTAHDAGWTVGENWIDVLWPLAFIFVTVTRTGAPISLPAKGEFGPHSATKVRPADYDGASFGFRGGGAMVTSTRGRVSYWFLQNGDAMGDPPAKSPMWLQAVDGCPTAIATGEVFAITGVYPLDASSTFPNP
jgi:hypothetical protein